jgi:hypothetical protein
MISKIVTRGLLGLFVLVAWLVWLGWFSTRPPLTTDPATLAGDGSMLDYCELPVLDGLGEARCRYPKGQYAGVRL